MRVRGDESLLSENDSPHEVAAFTDHQWTGRTSSTELAGPVRWFRSQRSRSASYARQIPDGGPLGPEAGNQLRAEKFQEAQVQRVPVSSRTSDSRA